MEEILCIILILLLLCCIYHIVNNCGCNDGFNVGGQTMCDPTSGGRCPGDIACPDCGSNSCECPKPAPIYASDCTKDVNDCSNAWFDVDVKYSCNAYRNNDGKQCEYDSIIEYCRDTNISCDGPSPAPGPSPGPSGPSPGPGDLNCVNSDFKGLCIDDYSARIGPETMFSNTTDFKWPLTNNPIKMIRTYNWNNMKNWVIWAFKNKIKVLLGVTNTDKITTDEKKYLKDNKNNIIGIVYWNEPKYNPSANAGPNILKDALPNKPSMISYSHRNVNDYDTINDNILAVNIYGLYYNMGCCDDCSESKDQITLDKQLPWNKETILINEFDDIFKVHPNIRLWITETGWGSYPAGCLDPTCEGDTDPCTLRKIAWSNIDNLTRNYKEFLKYDNSIPNTPEYIFYFCLSDTFGQGGPQPEKFGLYDNSFPPQLKIK
tara:strand:- start:6532 stop:7827 length:1296 start_codon:yes stop_codon:yes gene_type:complete